MLHLLCCAYLIICTGKRLRGGTQNTGGFAMEGTLYWPVSTISLCAQFMVTALVCSVVVLLTHSPALKVHGLPAEILAQSGVNLILAIWGYRY